ncbi:MAG TPA: ASKHA domain-containing protein [Thermoguttaceae bacterium]|nr:ASKHA domain-containing protein [Thermoguttaceae bacterium]
MEEREVAVTLEPLGKTIHVLQGTRLIEAIAGAGMTLDQPCGGEGTCGKCRVRMTRGACEATLVDQQSFSPKEIRQGWRLACQAVVEEPATIEVPETSLLPSRHRILTTVSEDEPLVADPALRKRYVELPPPTRDDAAADMLRLETAVGSLEADVDVLRILPGRLRETGFRGTVVTNDDELIDFEPGNTENECCAVAVDVGTTTLGAMLLDVPSGQQRAIASRTNPQAAFGDDVLARILHARQHPQGLHELHQAIVEAVDEMIGELCDESGVARNRIYKMTVSGNTTMQQLFCRIDTSSLGEVPFVPTAARRIVMPAAKLGVSIHPRGRVYVMPVIGGFVGGDTVSGILATGLAESDEPTLFVDIGTNGEIVLFANGRLTAASTAAGPAFEGARISQGMRAAAGAIEKVLFEERLHLHVIGNVAPVGLCGSALVDLAAELLRHGVLSSEGRLLTKKQMSKNVPEDLRRRVIAHKKSHAFLLAEESQTSIDRPILVTQRDFRELQLATGAIRAGITILLKRAGLQAEDVEKVFLAGGFGNFIRRSNAQRIGLLPTNIPRHRIRYQGNTSLAGARLAALSRTARVQAEQLARRTEHVDLSGDPDFQNVFAESMIFPEEE